MNEKWDSYSDFIKRKKFEKNLFMKANQIEFFEVKVDNIFCLSIDENNKYIDIHISLNEFEQWLNSEGYLSGGADDTTTGWNYTMSEFMQGEVHNWNLCELLSKFLNKK